MPRSTPRPPKRPRLLVEELEPRILYSADAAAMLGLNGVPGAALVRQFEPAPVPDRAVDAAQPTATPAVAASAHEIVFIDSRVPDAMKLADELMQQRGGDRVFDIVILDANEDGIAQINRVLANEHGLAAIHIISHGADGALEIGSTHLDASRLAVDAESVARWGQSLSAGGDLLLYGCDVAQGASGQAFVQSLARLTGADVAASTDLTGQSQLGGNWNLEYTTGRIEASVAIGAQTQQDWANVLAITVGNTSSSQTTGANSLTLAQTIGSGTNGILVVTVSFQAGSSNAVTSVTYGGTALTFLGSAENASGAHTRTEMWYLKAPAAGTANVVISMNASIAFTGGATNFFGVDQTTPTGTFVGATANNRTPSVTVASAAGELVIDSLAERSTSSGTTGGGQTELYHQLTGTAGGDTWGSSSTEAGAASVTMSWATVGSGTGEWAAGAVSLKPYLNTAPTLDAAKSPALNAINEDPGAPSGAVGTLVSSLVDFAAPSGQVDNVTDPDAGALLGIAVTAADTTNGTWWYSTNNGSSWNALGAVADNNARLLAADANTRVYFQPNANYNGTLANAITFRAWDQTTGTAGGTADTSNVTNTTLDQFSVASYGNNDGTASWSGPWVETDGKGGGATAGDVMVTGGTLQLRATKTNDLINRLVNLAGATTATLSFNYDNQLTGSDTIVAQVSNDGGATYTTVATFSAGSNFGTGSKSIDISSYIASNSQVQFAITSGGGKSFFFVDNVQVSYGNSGNGGTSAFSAATDTASLVINAVNDAPVLDNTGTMVLANIQQDATNPAGTTVAAVIASAGGNRITDVDAGAVEGIAITARDNSNGTWQYSINGGVSWVAMGNVNGSQVLVLSDTANDMVRFVPGAGFSGSAAISFRAWDRSDGLVSGTSGVNTNTNGGITPFSSTTQTASVYVEPLQVLLWMSTSGDVSGSGVPGLSNWTQSTVLAVGDPGLSLGAGTTGGRMATVTNFDGFAVDGDVNINGLHFVNRAVTLNGAGIVAGSLNLLKGDMLFVTASNESLSTAAGSPPAGWANNISTTAGDVYVFRPVTAGDYSSGYFRKVMAGPGANATRDIALVETATTVGGTVLTAGDILFTQSGNLQQNNIYWYKTATNTASLLIDGSQIGIPGGGAGAGIDSLDLVQSSFTSGGFTFQAGDVLAGFNTQVDAVGSGGSTVTAYAQDLVRLRFTATTFGAGTAVASAMTVLDGANIKLDTANENLDAVGLLIQGAGANVAPVVTLAGTALAYAEGAGPVIVDTTATVSDVDSPTLNTGVLRVDLTVNGSPDDRLAIRNQGNGVGQIGVVGSNVSYGGVLIGTLAGGTDGSTPLLVTLNASATPAAAQALLRNVTYENVSNNPSALPRTLRVLLSDGDGATSSAVGKTINVTNVDTAPVAVNDAYSVNEDSTLVVAPSTANLANWWGFNEGGSTQTISSSGSLASSATRGSMAGVDAADPTWTTGYVGGSALAFNGAGQYVDTTSTDLKTASNFTLSAWFQTNTTTGAQHLLWAGYAGGNGYGSGGSTTAATSEMSLSIGSYTATYDNKIVFFLGYDVPANGADCIFIASASNFTDTGNWHNVAVTVTDLGGGVMSASLYVDGKLEGTDTGSQNDRSVWGALRIGAPGDGTRSFNGKIDDVRVYSTALAPGTVQGIATAGVLANDSDVDSATLKVNTSVVTGPANGTLSINSDGSFTYTPNANFYGTDSFTYKANDDVVNSNVATATITVNPVVDTPSVTNATTNEDTQSTTGLVISRNAADGAEVGYFQITGISNGTLYQNDGTTAIANNSFITFAQGNAGLKFTPAANFNGNGNFTVQASTTNAVGGLGGSTVNATITVNAVNDAPLATGSAALSAINEDTASPAGATVSSLFAANFSDSADQVTGGSSANTFAGIAISSYTVDATKGIWQYSTNTGGSWTALGNATTSAAITLDAAASTMLRFVPAANYNGAATALSANLIESGLAISSGAIVNLTGATGTTTHISAATVALGETITAVNDAPVQVFTGANFTGLYAYNDASGNWFVQNTPVDTGTIQSKPQGAALHLSDSAGGSSSSGVIVYFDGSLKLGDLLGGSFASTGSALAMNIYLDSGNDGQFFSFSGAQFTGLNGDSYGTVALGANGGAFNDNTVFTKAAGIAALPSTFTLAQLKAGAVPGIDVNTRVALWIGGGNSFSSDISNISVAARTAGSLTVQEDSGLTSLGLGGAAFGPGDGADEAGQTLTYTVTAVPNAAVGSVVLADGSTVVTASTGYSLAQIQGMQFRTAANANGAGGTFSFSVQDSGGTLNGGVNTITQALALSVAAVNDPPVNTLPAAQITTVNTPIVLSGSNAISVSDVDAGGGQVRVTLGVADYQQGFESNNLGWNMQTVEGGSFVTQNDATIVASGTNGITARSGSTYAVAAQNALGAGGSAFTPFAATRATGYSNVFPPGGFTTSVDVYLDPSGGSANDTQFDYTAAISDVAIGGNGLPLSRRDFVFNAGFYNDVDATGSTNRFVISASSNAGHTVNGPRQGASPLAITTAGWYTLEHRFYDSGGGVLAVDLIVKDSAGTALSTWTRSNPTDIIGTTVGGGRYGWFANQEFSSLAFDNVSKTSATRGTLTLASTANLSFTQGDGTNDSRMTFTGTLADINAALSSVTYQPANNYSGSASLLMVSNDMGNTGGGGPSVAFGAVPLTVNAPPVVATTGAPLAYTENDPATVVDPGLTVSDTDSANLTGASVTISSNYSTGQDVLAFTSQNGITGSWNASTGTLTLSGTTTVANYQTALRSVTYVNSSDAPSTLARTVSFAVVDDSSIASTAVSRTVTVAAVNDAPTLGNGTLASVAQNAANPSGQPVSAIFAGQFADVDTSATLSGIAVVGNTANASTQGSWQYSTNAGGNWYGVGTVADDSTALALSSSTLVRFVPVAGYNGTPVSLVVRGLDNAYAGAFATTAGSEVRATVDTTSNGSTTAIAAATANLSTSITPSTSGAISGTVYEDVNGDSNLSDAVGAGNVTVRLYRDDGSGTPDAADTLVGTTTTAAGSYSFTGLADGTYWVVVDARTITPNAGFNAGFGAGDVWADQTYGAAGSVAYGGGTYNFSALSGSFFGGMRANASDDAASLATAEHVTREVVTGSAITGVNAAFSFNVVTTTRGGDSADDDGSANRTVQGSLRQFIQNADAIAGANAMRFVPTAAANASDSFGNAWWRLDVTSVLPSITDAATTLDGTAYAAADGTTVRNTNAGQIGAGGTVGVDGLTLDRVNRPELEIAGSALNAPGITVDAASGAVRNLAIDGFVANGGGATYAGTQLRITSAATNAGGGVLVSGNLIGARADGTNPGMAQGIGISLNGAATVSDNYIAFTMNNGVMLSDRWMGQPNTQSVTFADNELAFIGDPTGGSGDMLSDISNGAVVRGNYLHDFVGNQPVQPYYGKGIEIWYQTQGALIENNTIVNMRTAGIGVNDGAQDNVIRRNVITGTTGDGTNGGVGILVTSFNDTAASPPSGNRITENTIYANAGLGIDIDPRTAVAGSVGDGVTANDAGDADTGGNALQNFPVLSGAATTGSQIAITGTLNSSANSYYRIEFFGNTTADASGYGEGQRFIGFANVSTDASGNATISTTLTATVAVGESISATATKSDSTFTTFSDTSEFAQDVTATAWLTATNMNAAETYIEDTALNLTDIVVGTTSATATATLTLSNAAAGSLSTATSGSVTSTFAAGVWTASGAVANVNTLLAGLTFTPSLNFNGNFTIATSVSDGVAAPVSGNKAISGSPVADTLSVTNATTNEDTQSTTGLVISRNAADGAEVGYFQITGISNGTLYQNDGTTAIANNSFITFAQGNAGLKFTPAANFNGSGNFTAQASTTNAVGGLGGGMVNATITVNPVADTPSATNATTNEDTQSTTGLVISRNAADGAEVGFFQITGISNGTLYQNDGTTAIANNSFITFAQGNAGLKFTPVANFNGIGSFTAQASTTNAVGGLGGSTVNATITVNPVNDEQVLATNTGVTVAENSTGTVITSGMLATTDIDNTAAQLIYTVSSAPANGTLRRSGVALTAGSTFSQADVNGGLVTYDHNGTETASDAFGFSVDDGAGAASAGSFAITVTPVNDNAPLITSNGGGASASVNVAENSTAVSTVAASDADLPAQTLTYSISGGADAAKFSINASTGVLSFLAAPDYEAPTDVGGNNVYDVIVQVSDGALTDNQAIAVTVTAVNDNAPVITSDGGGATASVNVAENVTAVTTVTATDADLPVQTLTYSISGGADAAKFSINSSTGALSFVSAPNFEVPTDIGTNNVYDVIVQVSDGTLADTQAIAVTVTPVNDNTPVISSDGGGASAAINVAENSSAVTTVTASDADLPAQTLTYSISGGADAAKFTINASTGVLTFVSAPNYEVPTDAGANNVYDVIVQVSDGSLTDTQSIAVTVTAVNDNAPVITSDGGAATATVNVAENGTAVTTVSATDADLPSQTLTYSISGGADAAKFAINSGTGVLSFLAAPDYEAPTDAGANNVYDVIVQVSDGTLTDTQAIAVTVTPLNDNAPVIGSDGGGANAAISVAENSTAVTMVAAADGDLPAQTLVYSITGGADAAKFTIDSSTGALAFIAAPDYEVPTDAGANNVYDVIVQVSDGSLTDTQTIAVTVTPVNEGAPVISSDGGGASATMNVAENSTAVTTVAATDADLPAQTLTYSISGGADAARFTINSATGALSFVAAPDYEAPTDAGLDNVYDVIVQVSDGLLTDTQAIAVTVTPMNDNAPVITSDGAGATASLSVAENTGAVTAVTATDADVPGQTLTYSISGGADAAKFTINAGTGVLAFVAAPDYEAPTDVGANNVYDVIVQVSDGTLTDSQAIAVTVTPVNDNAPAITSDGGGATASVNVAENTSAVTTVTATDADLPAPTLTYSITGGADAAKFTINATTGALTFVLAPNFEVPTDIGTNNIYDVIVQASDGTLTDTQAIAVTVTAVNDNTPVITSDGGGASASVNVAENATAVTTVTATDADLPAQTLTYSISGGADAGRFTIDSATGVLSFVAAPDYEAPTDAGLDNVYDVIVQVSDGTLTATQSIAVTVTAVNDNAPVITSDGGGAMATLNVAENIAAVSIVTATDADLPAQTLTYSISGGADAAKFSINASTGVLSFLAAPNYEAPTDAGANNIYDVIVQVSDGTLTSTQAIAVMVDNVNEAPVITSDGGGATATRSVAENDTAVTTVTATDVDAATTLTYSISGGADAAKFTIDASSGALSFVAAPDFETPTDAGADNVYDVIVQVSDGTLTDTQAIAVSVTPVSDNAPVITSNGGGATATVNVAENATAVSTVMATDADLPAQTLTYSIVGGADAGRFTINAATGVLSFVTAPDYEAPSDAGVDNVYDVTVQVSDGTLTDSQAIAVAVTAVNDNAPVITSNGGGASASLSVAENTTAVTTVTASDADLPIQTLTYSIAGGADAGRFNIDSATGALSFVATPDFEAPSDSGADNTYDVIVQASDGTLASTQAIAVTVLDVNEAPQAADHFATVAEGAVLAIDLAAGAADVDAGANGSIDLSSAVIVVGPTRGSLVLNADGTATYSHDGSETTSDSFSYTLRDAAGATSNVATVRLTVTPVNDAPTVAAATLSLRAGQGLVLDATQLQATDPDNAAASLSFAVSNVSNGRFEWVAAPGAAITQFTQADVAAGRVRFVSTSGTDAPTFRVMAFDGQLYSAEVSGAIVFTRDAVLPADDPATVPPKVLPGVAGPADATVQSSLPVAAPIAASAAELPAPGHDVDLSDAPLVRFEPAAPRQGRAAVAAEPVRSHASGSDLELSVGIADDYAIRALQLQVLDAAQSARPGLHAGPQNDSSNAVQTSDEESSTGLTLVEAAQITGVALTAGTVWWALRAGGLLAGLMVSLPAWRHADLLAVLPDDEEDDNWDLAEDDEAARDEQAVAQVFEPAFEGDLR